MAEVHYSARLERPGRAIERARTQIITCPVYSGATLTAPASGTCTVSSADATVSTGVVSVVSSVAEYTITSAELAALDFGDGWAIEWALTMPDGAVHTFREEAALCRLASQQRITPADIYQVEPYFNKDASSAVWTETCVDQCWEAHLEVEESLWGEGRRPYLIVSQTSLRALELLTALRLCCEAMASTGRETYRVKADRYSERLRETRSRTTLQYDTDGDGRIDDASHRSAVRSAGFRLGSIR
jgi:hypothetical protein